MRIMILVLLIFAVSCANRKANQLQIKQSDLIGPAVIETQSPTPSPTPTHTPTLYHRVINFDTDVNGNSLLNRQFVNNQYSDWGVSFSIASASPRTISQNIDPNDSIPVSAPYCLGGNTQNGFSSTEPLTITFVNPVSNVKFYVIDLESAGGSAAFKDESGNILETVALQNLGSGANQLVSSNSSEIKSIEVTNQSAGDGFMVDDLEFDIVQ